MKQYVDLLKKKEKSIKIPPEIIVSAFKFMVEFVLLFYDKVGFFHGDMKPDNLLMVHTDNDQYKFKTIDFGTIKERERYRENTPFTPYYYLSPMREYTKLSEEE